MELLVQCVLVLRYSAKVMTSIMVLEEAIDRSETKAS